LFQRPQSLRRFYGDDRGLTIHSSGTIIVPIIVRLTQALDPMKALPLALSGALLASACSHVPYANNRPARPNPPGSELVKQCEVTVRFNEDEQSVPESEYIDSFFCLGLMEGVLNTNRIVQERTPQSALFCPPSTGLKNWLAAKAVVEYAKARPDLLELDENEFTIAALAAAFPCKQL